jgi:hypothetical protein
MGRVELHSDNLLVLELFTIATGGLAMRSGCPCRGGRGKQEGSGLSLDFRRTF